MVTKTKRTRVVDIRKIVAKVRINPNDTMSLRISKVLVYVAEQAPYQFVPVGLLAKCVLMLPNVPKEQNRDFLRVRAMLHSAEQYMYRHFQCITERDKATGGVRATVDGGDMYRVLLRKRAGRTQKANETLHDQMSFALTLPGLTGKERAHAEEIVRMTKRLTSPAVKALLAPDTDDEDKGNK